MGVAVRKQDRGSKMQRRTRGLRRARRAARPNRVRRAAPGRSHGGSSFGRSGRCDTCQITLDPARLSSTRKRPWRAVKWRFRKSLIVRKSGVLFPVSTRKATSS
jgi:hypothetical protein